MFNRNKLPAMLATRTLLACLSSVALCCTVHAQLVFLPDPAMRAWFELYAPGSVDVDGNLNTQDPALAQVEEAGLDLGTGITDITGLAYCPNLTSLQLFDGGGGCTAFTLDAWPPALTQLQVDRCALTYIPAWPSTLTTLGILYDGVDMLTELPYPLPASLEAFDLSGAPGFTTVPALPSGLKTLGLEQCPAITDLGPLPAGLEVLDLLSMHGVAALPTVPSGLHWLSLSSCHGITAIGTLPNTLTNLYLGDLPGLDAVPALPASVLDLGVESWLMEYWGTLPPTLLSLRIAQDWSVQAGNGDPYPGMCIPPLPDGIYSVDVRTNPIIPTVPVCLPNYPASLVSATFVTGVEVGTNEDLLSAIHTCVLVDLDCPLQSTLVKGLAFTDADGDGLLGVGEGVRPGASISVEPGGLMASSDADGLFAALPGIGSFTVSGQAPLYHTVTTAAQQADLLLVGAVDSLDAIGYRPIPGMHDLRAYIQCNPARPGFPNRCWAHVYNLGTEVEDVDLALMIDGDQSWVGSEVAATNVVGNDVQWTIGALPLNGAWSTSFDLSTAATVPLGTPLLHVLEATGAQADETPADNSCLWNDEVVSSYDPNDKQVEPAQLTSAEAQNGPELTYRIRFQNTGTYAAERVVITDTLSADLQWNTLRTIASSHANQWFVQNGVLHVVFDPIALPDSATDEAGSHGYFTFAMRARPGLLTGATIPNVANIHFDFNLPVITEAAVFAVEDNVGVEAMTVGTARLFPNPATDRIAVEVLPGDHRVQVIDLVGNLLMEHSLNGRGRRWVYIEHLPQGAYLLRTFAREGERTERFIKR